MEELCVSTFAHLSVWMDNENVFVCVCVCTAEKELNDKKAKMEVIEIIG